MLVRFRYCGRFFLFSLRGNLVFCSPVTFEGTAAQNTMHSGSRVYVSLREFWSRSRSLLTATAFPRQQICLPKNRAVCHAKGRHPPLRVHLKTASTRTRTVSPLTGGSLISPRRKVYVSHLYATSSRLVGLERLQSQHRTDVHDSWQCLRDLPPTCPYGSFPHSSRLELISICCTPNTKPADTSSSCILDIAPGYWHPVSRGDPAAYSAACIAAGSKSSVSPEVPVWRVRRSCILSADG
mmetsp:Transcript_35920/g.143571  ORF Transcript_35920/g.143571 Transcript_35920/m.143571 type:complete len:239 (+) Transcript_35920:806-1522(+)